MIIRLVDKIDISDEFQVLPVEPFFQVNMWSYNGSEIWLVGNPTIERNGILQELHETLTSGSDEG